MFIIDDKQVDTIQHFGILGMRWGVRSNNKSETIIKAKVDVKKARMEGRFSSNPNKVLDYKFKKQDLTNAKILDKLNSKY